MIAEHQTQSLFGGILKTSLSSLSVNLNPYGNSKAIEIEIDYKFWLQSLFKTYVSGGFSPRHDQLWNWVWSLQKGVRSSSMVAIWPRGGGKSTTAELATAMVGAMGKRNFVLYIRASQDKADESVQNVAGLLESPLIDLYYPKLGDRRRGKFGSSKGWRRESLRTSSGFTVEGAGFDSAVRGLRDLNNRPDLIILDDIDDRHDSELVSQKKKEIITNSILPMGSVDCAVLGVQNLIIPHGIFSQLTKPDCDFLIDRIVSGPYPAIDDLEYKPRENGIGYQITSGVPTWPGGQSLEVCENQINTWGLQAFLRESQHEVDDDEGSMFSAIQYKHCSADEVPDLVRVGCWVDPAVTADGDCQGIQIDGIADDGSTKSATIYRLYSWEGNQSPTATIKQAILKAVEYKAEHVGFETNQGGDLWEETYKLIAGVMLENEEIDYIPKFKQAKADSSTGGKSHRAGPMLTDYEQGRIVHVFGTHTVLERALKRFLIKKPFDLVDASVWARFELRKGSSTMA